MKFTDGKVRVRFSKLGRWYKLLMLWFVILSVLTLAFAPSGREFVSIPYVLLYVSFVVLFYVVLRNRITRINKEFER